MTRSVGELRIEVSDGIAVVQPAANQASAKPDGNEVFAPARAIAWPGDELRQAVRSDDLGRYRPLSGAKSMPRGWKVECAEADVGGVLESVYPLALVHRRQWDRGELRVVGLDEVLKRQTGRYEVAAELESVGRDAAREVLCGDCVRTPVWSGERMLNDGLPCPEPCSVLISLCREAALWQTKRPEPAETEDGIPYAAFDHSGNAIREAYLAKRAP